MTNLVRENPQLHYISAAAETIAANGTKTSSWQRVRRQPVATDITATTLPVVWERLRLRGFVYGANAGTIQVQHSPDNGTTILQGPTVTKPALQAITFDYAVMGQYIRLLYTETSGVQEVGFILSALIEEPAV